MANGRSPRRYLNELRNELASVWLAEHFDVSRAVYLQSEIQRVLRIMQRGKQNTPVN